VVDCWWSAPWEHPDWYDLHDTTWTAGPEREPEHYRELVIALPPLDHDDHLIDAGAGTGKAATLVARAYPRLGRVTLIEPNLVKLERAVARLGELLSPARVRGIAGALGEEGLDVPAESSVVIVASVLMPILELRGGSLGDGLAWIARALRDVGRMLRPGGWLYDLETLAPPWARGDADDPVRRLHMFELAEAIGATGLEAVECAYRFRDRVIVRARRPAS
jgi:SAM-dependent methyltransferase